MKTIIFMYVITLLQHEAMAFYYRELDKLSGELEILLDDNLVRADITYRYVPSGRPLKDTVQFYLPLTFAITTLEGPAVSRYEEVIDTTTFIGKFFKTINVYPDKSSFHQPFDIHMKYESILDLQSKALPDNWPDNWIEVSINTIMLTPILTDFSASLVELLVKVPDEYELVAAGQTVAKRKGETLITSNIPTRGVYFLLGKHIDIEEYPYENNKVTIASYHAGDSLKQTLAQMVNFTLNFYNSTFATQNPKRKVTVTLRPIPDWDASFAAGNNYFSTYDSQEDFFKRNTFHFGNYAHEIAHFWWLHADVGTSNNWLNESLAEYCSILARKQYYGQEQFTRRIDEHQNQIKQVPNGVTLMNYERYGPYDKTMAYSEGTLVLHTIYQHVGEQEFYQLLNEIDAQKISTTEQFVSHIDKKFDGQWIEKLIERIGM